MPLHRFSTEGGGSFSRWTRMVRSLQSSLTNSYFSRGLLLGVLVLVLQLPVFMIRGIVSEREARRDEVTAEVSSKWGSKQTIVGPILVIPYAVRVERRVGEVLETTLEERRAHILPSELIVAADLKSQVRHRGIFAVPLYSSTLAVRGHFEKLTFAPLREAAQVYYDRAQLVVFVEDARGISSASPLVFGAQSQGFSPAAGAQHAGIASPVEVTAEQPKTDFSFSLTLRGTGGLFFAPVGEMNRAELTSDWPHPSFQGGFLPETSTVTANGFRASYAIPHLGRGYPSAFSVAPGGEATDENLIKAHSLTFGTELSVPVDHYRMAERSTKYGFLFLLLTFGALWLFEVLSKLRIHTLQYLLIGAAMCLFFLLQLALSEHIGFANSYTLASAMVTLLVAGYSVAVLKNPARAAVIGGVLSALYGGLFILLRHEDFSLLFGSLALFVVLGLVMYLTRAVDWSAGTPVLDKEADERV